MMIPMPPRKTKRMLEVQKTAAGYEVAINSSSLDLIQTCKRKAFYALHEGYRSEDEGEALVFGKAIHEALEVFYSVDPVHRTDDILAQARQAFDQAMAPLSLLPDSDKRSKANGQKILTHYFQTYAVDEWVVYRDELGAFVERPFELNLFSGFWNGTPLRVSLFGTIDLALKNVNSGELVVVDHKTSTALGQEFYNRIKPNHQFTGYILGAQLAFRLPVTRFMVNGIQVAKTKSDLVRVFTERTAEDFMEFKDTIEVAVADYLRCLDHGIWPMGPASACSQFAGCQYRNACASAPHLRKNILDQQYGRLVNDVNNVTALAAQGEMIHG